MNHPSDPSILSSFPLHQQQRATAARIQNETQNHDNSHRSSPYSASHINLNFTTSITTSTSLNTSKPSNTATMRTVTEILTDIGKVHEVYAMLQQNGLPNIEILLFSLGRELASATSVGAAAVQSVISDTTKPVPSATSNPKVAISVVKDQTAPNVSKQDSTISNLKPAVVVLEDQTASDISKEDSIASNLKAAVGVKEVQTTFAASRGFTATSALEATVDTLRKDQCTPDTITQEPSTFSDSSAAVDILEKNQGTSDVIDREPFTTSDAVDVHSRQLDRKAPPYPADIPDKAKLEAAAEYVRKILPWNEEQLKVFDNAREIVDRVMFVHGAAGTGKTAVAVALAKYYIQAGFHCLITAPNHSTADEIVKKHLVLGNNDIRPVRVYPSAQERIDVEFDETNNLSTASVKHDSSNKEHFDLTLLAAIDEVRTGTAKRAFKMDNISLEAQVQEIARNRSRKLVRAYEVAEDQEEGPTVDMWEEMRGFLNKMKTTPLKKWAHIDRIKYGKAIKYTKRDIISDYRLIVSTTNTVVCEDIERCFGSTAKGIVIIQDAVVMKVDQTTWCPSIKLDNHNKVKAWIMFGDDEQSRPRIISPSRTPASNEHVPIPMNSLFTRLRNANSSTIRLTEQNRMHTELAKWPNDRMYKGQLRNGKATHGRLDEDLAKLMAKYLEISGCGGRGKDDVTESPKRLHFVNVSNGSCKTNRATTSRYNAENVQVVIGFIKLLRDHKIIPRLTARLITPYHDQLRLYNSEYDNLERNSLIPSAELPILSTIDGVQGREAQIVIFDSVVSSADCKRDLGLLMDDRRLNMVCSRAQEVFLLVGNVNVLSGNFSSYWDKWKGREIGSSNITPPNPEPYLLGLIKLLTGRNDIIYVEAETSNTLPKVLQTPGPAIRRLGGR